MHCIYLFKREFIFINFNGNEWFMAVLLNWKALKIC